MYRLARLAVASAFVGSLTTTSFATGTVVLGDWQQSETEEIGQFALNAQAEKVAVWGRGSESPRAYLDEFLPALFERTCVLDEIDAAGATLEWIFTGPNGGFTVRVAQDRAELSQRFYDSYGFNTIRGGKIEAGRHPESIWQQSAIEYEGTLRAVTVRLDHRLGLDVLLNDRPALHQTCLFDVSRHQLRFVGAQGRMIGRMASPATRQTEVTVDPVHRHQEIIGFGGITSPTAYRQLSPAGKRRWWELVCEYNLLIQREYPIGTRLNEAMDNWDTITDATPHYYGDNFPNGEISDFDYIRTLRRLNGVVFFEFWGLPPWAVRPTTDAAGELHPDTPDVDAYVRAVVRYCEISREKTGHPPDVVGIQNEKPQPVEVWYEMTRALRRGLDEAGFDAVKIHLTDSGSLADGIRRLARFRDNDEVYDLIDYPATHMYDYQAAFTDPDSFDAKLEAWQKLAAGKPFLSTELCINHGLYQIGSYRLALLMGQLYHKNLTIADAAAICYCWTLLNVAQPSYGATRSLMAPDQTNGFVPAATSHQLRVFGAFSRRLPRGMTRIEATSTSKDLFVSAFLDDKGRGTIILLNRDVTSHVVSLAQLPIPLTEVERVDLYHSTAAQPLSDVTGGARTIRVLPGSIVTLTSVEPGQLPPGFALLQE